MDFSPTEAQQELAALTRRIVSDQLTPERLREADARSARFDQDLWADLADAGVLAAALPESVGGSGCGILEQCSILAELGRAVAPVPYLPAITMGATALARFGDAKLRDRWAAPAAHGQAVVTAALAEPHAEVPYLPSTQARRGTRGWSLDGEKIAVPAGTIADAVLVPAAGTGGTTVFVVTPDDPGVTVREQLLVDGDMAASVGLEDAVLGDDRVLGTPGRGDEIVESLAAAGTVGLCAAQLGVCERALELTAEYARTRVQFGRPIGSFQAVSQRLADAYVDVQAIRLTLWQAAWRIAEGLPWAAAAATAKFWAADGGHRVAHTAVHVHGGMGIDLDHPVHRYFLAAKRHEFELGGATAQLRRLGDELARS